MLNEVKKKKDYEGMLAEKLKKRGATFIRQFPIGPYTADFYLFPNIVAEVEGFEHYIPDRVVRDEIRTDYLERKGYRVLRISVEHVKMDTNGIAKYLLLEQNIQSQKLASLFRWCFGKF